MFEAIIGFGYSGWILTVLLVGAFRWTLLERDIFADHQWPYLE